MCSLYGAVKTFEDFETGMRVAHWVTGKEGVVMKKDQGKRKICIVFDDGQRCAMWPEAFVLEFEYKPPEPSPDQDGEPPPEAAVGATSRRLENDWNIVSESSPQWHPCMAAVGASVSGSSVTGTTSPPTSTRAAVGVTRRW